MPQAFRMADTAKIAAFGSSYRWNAILRRSCRRLRSFDGIRPALIPGEPPTSRHFHTIRRRAWAARVSSSVMSFIGGILVRVGQGWSMPQAFRMADTAKIAAFGSSYRWNAILRRSCRRLRSFNGIRPALIPGEPPTSRHLHTIRRRAWAARVSSRRGILVRVGQGWSMPQAFRMADTAKIAAFGSSYRWNAILRRSCRRLRSFNGIRPALIPGEPPTSRRFHTIAAPEGCPPALSNRQSLRGAAETL